MITYLVVGIGLPVLALVGNSAVRIAMRLPQSTPADLILVLLVFDVAVLIQPDELTILGGHVREWYGAAALICVALWTISVGRLEKDLHVWMSARPRRGYPYRLMITAHAVSVVALIINLSPIVWSVK